MTAIMYYVLPMLLGRTYDMKTNSPGVDIFPQEAIEGATAIQRHFTDAQYKMISDSREARDFLGVSGDLSLKIKAGTVNVEGLGNYMRDTASRANVVEILVKVHFETETLTLPSTAEPVPGWRTLDLRDIGTHYVRSITYGGDLVASLRFSAKNSADREMIRSKVQSNLQADSGSFGLGIEGNFSRLQEDLKDSTSLEINYYATVPIKGVPNTMESLMELVEGFPAQTQLVNEGKGVPLSMELFPLSALDSDLPRYLETKALADQLDQMEMQFDDIRATKKAFQEWMLNVPPVLTPELEEEIGLFNDELQRISFVFYNVLGNLNLDENADVGQFKDAFDAYAQKGGSLPDKYFRKFQLLRHKIIQSSKALQTDVGGTTYVHWGRSSCSSEGTQSLVTGIAASTDRTKGGSATILCLTDEPQLDPDADDYQRHHRFYSRLSPVYAQGRNVSETQPVSCATCFIEERTSARTFPGRTACPPAWNLEYSGYLATKTMRSRKGDYICLDTDMDVHSGDPIITTVEADMADDVSDLKIACGLLPCEPYREAQLLPCVVCSY